MEKVITIIAEVAVAALVLAGVVLLTTTLMDAGGGNTAVIYNITMRKKAHGFNREMNSRKENTCF